MTTTALQPPRRWRFSLRGRIWPLVGGLAVALLWIISAAANFHAGAALSSDEHISTILGSASIGADLMKAVVLFAVVAALANKRHGVAFVGIVIFALCAAWSMRSALYFVSTTLTQTVAERTLKHDIQQSKINLLDLKSKRAGFLSQQSIEVSVNNKYARRDAIAENQRSSGEFTALLRDIEAQQKELEAAPVAVAGDPIAALFNLTDRTVILASALFFAALLEIASGFGFWVIAVSRQAKIVDAVAIPSAAIDVTPPVLTIGGTGGDGGGLASPAGSGPGYGMGGYGAPPSSNTDDIKHLSATTGAEPDNVVVPFPRSAPACDRAERVTAIVAEKFDAATLTERIPVASIAAQINAALPTDQRVPEPHRVAELLIPHIFAAFPHAQKRKVGGRTFVYGVAQRMTDARRAM